MTLFSFDLYPTGVLYKTYKEACDAKKLKIRVGVGKTGILQQIDPHPLKYFKPIDGWLESNEPEEHLDDISIWLLSKLDRKALRIGAFSYKDVSLARRIVKSEPGSIEYAYDPPSWDGVSQELGKSWPEDCTNLQIVRKIYDMPKNLDIFIMRHYLEHFDDIELIIEAIADKTKEKGLIYIEVPECRHFLERGIPLFAWEQHKYYFTRKTIEAWGNKCGFECEVRVEGNSIEPSICCILSKRPCKKVIDFAIVENTPAPSNTSFKLYLESWEKMLAKRVDKYILGIGHNSDRFLQLIANQDMFQGLIDSSQRKVGYYLASSHKPIQNKLPVRQDSVFELVLGVHDRAYNALARKLSERYKYAKISSIFKAYEFT